MPLHKRKPFPLVEPPKDLDPHEFVFQIRFTKEIFRDYPEYLNRLNLYRQRVWTCKVTGKTNFTYEEALVSEQRATEKVQQIPKESVPSILQMVQYSTLRLKDLVIAISTKLQEPLLEGVELYGRKERSMCLCRVLKVIKNSESTHYEVGWLDKNRSVTDTSIVTANELIRKKLPFSRNVLKSFIRESTWRSMPWVVHEKLARKHGLSTEPPEELIDKITSQNGCLSRDKDYIKAKARWKNNLDAEIDKSGKKRKAKHLNSEGSKAIKKKAKKEEKSEEEPVKYPIDDLLVKPGADDPVFTERPSPSRDFIVPMDCVGDLIMVWDFCSSFSRLLNLWPFSLEDFEKAICHKDSDLLLIFESHAAILHLLIKDEGEYLITIQKKRRKPKITLVKWSEYLCDFLEMEDRPEISSHMSTIKRGHYGLLDVHVKLCILRELVSETLTTNAIREKLDEYIQQQQRPAATKEELRKKKGELHVKKEESDTKKVIQAHDLDNGDVKLQTLKVDSIHGKTRDKLYNGTEKFLQANGKHFPENGKGRHGVANSKTAKKLRRGRGANYDEVKNSSGANEGKQVQLGRKDKDKDSLEKTTEEQLKGNHEGEIEKRFIRTNALGKDRNHNQYWFFRRAGRLFVESSDSKQWGYYSTKEELDLFMGSLNPKGERERALKRQLERHYPRISLALQKRSRVVSQKILLEEAVLRRSTRVRAPPRGGPAKSFLRYVNRWKER